MLSPMSVPRATRSTITAPVANATETPQIVQASRRWFIDPPRRPGGVRSRSYRRRARSGW